MYVNKRYGQRKIALILNERGERTKRDHALYQNESIGRILQHKIYIGQVENKLSEVVDFLTGRREKLPEEEHVIVENEKLRIIPDELFYKAQEIREENRKKTRIAQIKNKDSHKFIFSTLIRCEHCGYSFFREDRIYKNHYVRWKCSGKKNLSRSFCDNDVAVNEEELIEAIKKYFNGILSNKKEFITKTIDKYNKILKEKNQYIKNEKELNKSLEKLKNTKQKYIDMYTDEMISSEEYKELTQSINNQINGVKSQIQRLKFSLADEDTLNKDIKNKMEEIENILNGNNFTNEGLKKIIDVININKNGNIEVVLRGLNNFDYDNEVIVRDIVEENKNNVEKLEIVENKEIEPKISTYDTSVHKDLTERLKKINPSLAKEVRLILDENKAERHIRGGMATKIKYLHMKEK